MPPLVGAAESRSTEIATRLVDAGAILDYYGRNSTDALSRAIEFNAREMVEHLVSLGAGRSPDYFRVVSLTNDPEIRDIVEAAIIDPNLE